MGDSGIYSQKGFVDGVMPQSQEGDALDLMVGSVLRVERKAFPELAVGLGVPGSIRNRLSAVDIYWPSAPNGPTAMDTFPSRYDNTQMPGARTVGEYLHSQAIRRRAVLARLWVAYVFRHAGDDGPLMPEHVSAAYRFRDEHRNDPAPEPEDPLVKTTYEESMTRNMGVSYDPTVGIGVRIKET